MDTSTNRSYGGTGLGLVISQHRLGDGWRHHRAERPGRGLHLHAHRRPGSRSPLDQRTDTSPGAGPAFDACLLDLHVPGMDGDELADRLRDLAGGATPWVEEDEDSVPASHRLKGRGAAMGAERLAELCRCLQEAADPASPGVAEAPAGLPAEARRVDAAVTDLLGVPR